VARCETAEATLKKHGDLDDRLVAIEKRERAAEVRDLQLQLTAQKEIAVSIKEIAMGLVRNTEYRKAIMNSESTPIMQQPQYAGGYPTQVGSEIKSSNTSTTESAA
jgi:hypothetical protein